MDEVWSFAFPEGSYEAWLAAQSVDAARTLVDGDTPPPPVVETGHGRHRQAAEFDVVPWVDIAGTAVGSEGDRDAAPNFGDVRSKHDGLLDAFFAMDSKPPEDVPTAGENWKILQGGDDAALMEYTASGGATLAVADGVGQIKNGSVASAAALLGVHEGVVETEATTREGRVRDMLRGAWGWISECRNAYPGEERGPATVLAVADIVPTSDGGADVTVTCEGDASGWYYDRRTEVLRKLTIDNAPPVTGPDAQKEYAKLRAEQARQDDAPRRRTDNRVSRYLSHTVANDAKPDEPPVTTTHVPKGSIIFLCTDGLTDRLRRGSIERVFQNLCAFGEKPSAEKVVAILSERALNKPDRTSKDDLTAVAAIIGE
ncbi:MAG: SpoIIE family protein phosphatase [Candidatus Saccharimonadales bacterium]